MNRIIEIQMEEFCKEFCISSQKGHTSLRISGLL